MKHLAVGLIALNTVLLVACALSVYHIVKPVQVDDFNWAIQGQDGAIKGCPSQYSQWVDIDDKTYLIGCWGNAGPITYELEKVK